MMRLRNFNCIKKSGHSVGYGYNVSTSYNVCGLLSCLFGDVIAPSYSGTKPTHSLDLSKKKKRESSTSLKVVLLSIALVSIISICLNLNVYLKYGCNYQVFLGPSELYKTLLNKIDSLSTQLYNAERRIGELQQNITDKDAEISKLRDTLYLKDREIERLRQYELRFIKVSGFIKSPGTPVEIVFEELFSEHRYKISDVNGKYMYEATLENNKEYIVVIRYEDKWWIVSLGIKDSKSITFRLNSDKPTLIKDFSVE